MKTQQLTQCALFLAILCLCAWFKISLPFTPVPITLQTFGVLLCAFLLRKNNGVLVVFVYLLLGCLGLPVFQGGMGGYGVLLGPTGGFLMGFLPMAFVVAFVWQHKHLVKNSKLLMPIAILLGQVVLYLCGTLWFMHATNRNAKEALAMTVLPFLLADCMKAFLAMFIMRFLPKQLYCLTI